MSAGCRDENNPLCHADILAAHEALSRMTGRQRYGESMVESFLAAANRVRSRLERAWQDEEVEVTLDANTPPDNDGEWITEATARALVEQLLASGPTPDRFERSTPLRAEADRDDTMGAETDPGLEMGEAETWFRDQLESEP